MSLTHRTMILGFDPQDDPSTQQDTSPFPVTGLDVTVAERPFPGVLHETAMHDWQAVMIERWPGAASDPHLREKFITVYRDRIDERERARLMRRRRGERPEDLY